jgi:hypothetical protein
MPDCFNVKTSSIKYVGNLFSRSVADTFRNTTTRDFSYVHSRSERCTLKIIQKVFKY